MRERLCEWNSASASMPVALAEYKKLTLSHVLVPHWGHLSPCDRLKRTPRRLSHSSMATSWNGKNNAPAAWWPCVPNNPPLSEHNNNNNKKPLHQSFRLRDNNKIAVRHLKNWHQQLNQVFLKWLPGDIVQQLFPDALWVTLLSCDFSSHDSKALRWSNWMLWHIFLALISYQMKGLGDFPAGLCVHLNDATWNNGSYIKKKRGWEQWLKGSWSRLKESFSPTV